MNISASDLCLYAVTDRSWIGSRNLAQAVEQAILGGVTCVQVREKNLSFQDFCHEALSIKKITDQYNIPLIINDSIEVAKAIDASGVHLGQDDLDMAEARQILGQDKIIGVSTHNAKEALRAEAQGADYIGIGAAFATQTKSGTRSLSSEQIKNIARTVHIPSVAIGGIHSGNIALLKGTGISGVALVSALFAQANIQEATKNLKALATSLFRG